MKKLSAMLIIMMLLCGMLVPATAATFTDTAGTGCETAVEVLSALGIAEGKSEGTFDPAASLTRAEMATILLRAMHMADGTGTAVFSDVPPSHWAFHAIAAAYQIGIVNGVSETQFMPDAAVSYEQAVKMVVAALGYTVHAEALGGYPSGYLAKAAHLDLLHGVKYGGNISRGDMAVLIYNALDAELLLKADYGTDAHVYTSDEGKTLLSHYLKVTHIKGEVEATPMARYQNDTTRLLDDEVLVSGTVMKVGKTAALSLMGIRSDIYTKMDEITDKPVILAIVPRKGIEVVDLASSDILSETDANTLWYADEDGKEVKADISGATLIWNGREETRSREHLTPKTGTVRLISGTGGNIGLILIESFTNYVAESVNTEEDTIYFKGDTVPSSVTVHFSDATCRTEMTDTSGAALVVKDIAEWDVLSIAESDARHSSRTRRIIRSKEAVTGVITEISTETVKVADVEYKKAETLCHGKMEILQDAAYYMDFTGKIVAANTAYAGTGRVYGWLQSAAFSKGLDAKPYLKLFCDTGEFKVFSLKETVDFNGVPTPGNTLIGEKAAVPDSLWAANVCPSLWKDGAVVPQLIAYKVNEEGEIYEIETAMNLSDPKLDTAEKYGNTYSMDWYFNADLGDLAGNPTEFNGTATGNTAKKLSSRIENVRGIFFGHVRTGNKTKFFIIPSDLSNEKGYAIRALSNYSMDDNRLADYVSFYDIDDSYFCGAMVMHSYLGKQETEFGDTYLDGSAPAAIVTGVSTILGEDGEILHALKLYTSGGANMTAYYDEDFRVLYRAANADIVNDPAWYTVDAEDKPVARTGETLKTRPKKMYMEPEDIMPGDVIQYEAEGDGKLLRVSMNFRAAYPGNVEVVDSANANPSSAVRNYYGGTVRMNGVVIKAMPEGSVLRINLADSVGMPKYDKSGNPETALRMLQTVGKFVIWDRETETMRLASVRDIEKGDEIFSYWKPATQVFTVIYR